MRWMIVNWFAAVTLVLGAGPEDSFREKPWEKLSSREVSDWGTLALGISSGKWVHGETDHFIVHATRNVEKAARRSEMFYGKIREFFGNRPDLMKGKSHVFAFGAEDDWAQFAGKIDQSWAAGITRGNEFFFFFGDEAKRTPAKAKVTAHEMTHLMFNRFFVGQLPLWLNEGIAEYFGQRESSTLTEFRRQMGAAKPYPLDELFAAKGYPSGQDRIQAFYAESAIIVDFLTKSEDRRALLPKFVDAVLKSGEFEAGLKVYGFKDRAEFEKEYRKHRKHF